ncbi:MAG TPA: TlpA disulfide reductase family protein [Jatrophihabitans sp.]|jgi:thiol-disulfide isomerase/thioredoxin
MPSRKAARSHCARLIAVTLCVASAGLILTLSSCAAGNPVGSPTKSTASSLDILGVTSFPNGKRTPVPTISGKTLAGGTVSSAQFAGDVIVINVWASWCAPCRAESPALAKLARSLQGQHVHFLGLDESDVRSAAIKFAAAVGATYPELADPDGGILARLRLLPVKGIPSTLVVDSSGRMAARVIGPVTADVLTQLVKASQLQ